LNVGAASGRTAGRESRRAGAREPGGCTEAGAGHDGREQEHAWMEFGMWRCTEAERYKGTGMQARSSAAKPTRGS
jgi:hypothetical protein